jgi:hypothetical protein
VCDVPVKRRGGSRRQAPALRLLAALILGAAAFGAGETEVPAADDFRGGVLGRAATAQSPGERTFGAARVAPLTDPNAWN